MEPLNPIRRAFTLLELLVVVAIVSVIATLAVAGWQRSQQAARAAACTNNLRQLGAALVAYLGEHDQRFPNLVPAREKREEDKATIDSELKPYVRDERIFACPADTKHLAATTGTSYLWNHRLNGQSIASLRVTFFGRETIEQLSRIMIMGDKEGFHPEPNKVNVLYADGHASKELTFVDDTQQ